MNPRDGAAMPERKRGSQQTVGGEGGVLAPLPPALRRSLFWRSLSLQASWNHQRMQNLGLLTTLLAWLRTQPRRVEKDRLFCRRHYEYFNTNPYLANYLIGGLIRLEAERASGRILPVGITAMFKQSLGRAFASLGDQLFWMGIQPGLIMGGCLAGLFGPLWLVLVVIGIFAAGQLYLRWTALDCGYRMGMDIVDLLQDPSWHRRIALARRIGMVLTGFVGGALLVPGRPHGPESPEIVFWAGLAAGYGLPQILRMRFPGEILVFAAALLAVSLSFAI
jgi:mannose/fructose/N-acetylgalactosamine-specific phosphotransferase system component IID